MIIACMGDVHLNKHKPANRKDEYWQTALDKLRFVFERSISEQAETIIFPGDLTDTPNLSNWEIGEIIDLFNEYEEIEKITTFGQHDMRYRTRPNTALSVLGKAIPSLHIMDNQSGLEGYGNIVFQASAYNEEIPKIVEGSFNILLLHRMIVDQKLWSKQEEFEPSNLFLRKHPFDLIVSGDNHQGFIQEGHNKKLLINCGSMLRSSIVQVDHQPFFVLFDTDSREYEEIEIPIKAASEVFLLDKVAFEKENNKNLDMFVEGLSDQKEVGLKYKENIDSYCKENKIEQEIIDDIEEAFTAISD